MCEGVGYVMVCLCVCVGHLSACALIRYAPLLLLQARSPCHLQLWGDPLPGEAPWLPGGGGALLRHHHTPQPPHALRAGQDGHQTSR